MKFDQWACLEWPLGMPIAWISSENIHSTSNLKCYGPFSELTSFHIIYLIYILWFICISNACFYVSITSFLVTPKRAWRMLGTLHWSLYSNILLLGLACVSQESSVPRRCRTNLFSHFSKKYAYCISSLCRFKWLWITSKMEEKYFHLCFDLAVIHETKRNEDIISCMAFPTLAKEMVMPVHVLVDNRKINIQTIHPAKKRIFHSTRP